MRKLMLLLPLLVAAAGARAGDVRVERVDLVDRGIYTIETGAETGDAGTPTGTITDVTHADLVEATTTVPARLGVEFGFRYVVAGAPDGAEVALDIVNIYPETGLPEPDKAEPLRRSEYRRVKRIGEPAYLGYGFENAWEAVPGTWTFQIWHDGAKLAEESFTVAE